MRIDHLVTYLGDYECCCVSRIAFKGLRIDRKRMNWSVDLCLCGELCIVLPSFIKLPNVMDYGQMF